MRSNESAGEPGAAVGGRVAWLELSNKTRTPRGVSSLATAATRGFQAWTKGQWLHMTMTTVASGASSIGTECSTPSVSDSVKGGTASPISKLILDVLAKRLCR